MFVKDSTEFKAALAEEIAGLKSNRNELIEEKRKLREKLQAAQKTIAGIHIDSAVDRAATLARCNPIAMRDIRGAAREVFIVNSDTNAVHTTDGKTPDAWLQEQKLTSPHWWGANSGGGAGGGVGVGGRDPSSDESTEELTGKQKLAAAMAN